MPNELMHHGIKGQRWGVRRTPEQLGHAPKKQSTIDTVKKKASELGKAAGNKIKSAATSVKNRISRKIADKKKAKYMTTEELRERISRLDMEKRYKDLLAQQNPKKTSMARELLSNAAKNLGQKALGVAVDKIVDKMRNKAFDINEWRNADLDKMDSETVAQVSKWYKDALFISNSRAKMKENAEGGGSTKDAGKNSKKKKKYTVKRDTYDKLKNTAARKVNAKVNKDKAIPADGVVHSLIKYHRKTTPNERNVL